MPTRGLYRGRRSQVRRRDEQTVRCEDAISAYGTVHSESTSRPSRARISASERRRGLDYRDAASLWLRATHAGPIEPSARTTAPAPSPRSSWHARRRGVRRTGRQPMPTRAARARRGLIVLSPARARQADADVEEAGIWRHSSIGADDGEPVSACCLPDPGGSAPRSGEASRARRCCC